jgi:hypothetical protein
MNLKSADWRMKHGRRGWILWTALASVAGSAVGAEIRLVENGEARAAICVAGRVMAADAFPIEAAYGFIPRNEVEFQRQQLREAVNDLAHYLGQMSGTRIEILTNAVPVGLMPIHIGERAVEAFGKARQTAPYRQGFRVVVGATGVGLIGESDLAVSYAIYELLDRLGCRWFMPSEWGACIPATNTIAVAEMDFSSAPGTLYRGIWQADQDFKRRNRCGGLPLAASHALDGYLRDDLTNHPDWVAVYKGKPIPPAIKWTKPEIAAAMADKIIGYLDQGTYKWSASLSPEDGIAFDESEDPQFDAGDWDPQWGTNSLTDRLMLLCNRVAARVVPKYPEVLFGVIAYVNYNRPPVREKLHPNIVPVIAPISYCRAHPVTEEADPDGKALGALIEGWGKAARMTGNYFYGWFLGEQTAPNPMITKWGVDVPFALKNGCKFFQPETTSNFETSLHALYLGLRLTWNPALKPEEIVDEINTLFYGHAAPEMAAYWDYVDRVWVDTKEFCGAGHGHMKRFTPERLKKMRELMNAALAAAQTPAEKYRVAMANESLVLFELYMKLRWDLAEGRWAKLGSESLTWVGRTHAMAERYRPQYAFSCRWYGAGGMWGNNDGVDWFVAWYKHTYDDAARIAKFYEALTAPPLRQWRYAADKDKQGESQGWMKPDYDDRAWKTTDSVVDSWSDLGFHNYFGFMWYRTTAAVPAGSGGQRTYLWIGATDGSAKVFVNGKHVPYVAPDGQTAAEFNGYMLPASWDISAAVQAGANQVSILCERRDVNEIGTGGIMGPVVIYRERASPAL